MKASLFFVIHMCQTVKAPLFFVIHMCQIVKARESVGRLVKPAVRPRKFATHKMTHGFEYK